MDTKQIKDRIKLAIDITADVPEPLKTKAFEITLLQLLNEKEAVENGGGNAESKPIEPSSTLPSIDDKIKVFAQTLGVTVNQLSDVFQFEEKAPKFIGRVNGNEADKQVQISRLLLLVSKDIYDQEWVDGTIISGVLQDYGVGSLNNLGRNLKNQENDFRTIGQKRAMKYKLTETGRQVAIASLKQIIIS